MRLEEPKNNKFSGKENMDKSKKNAGKGMEPIIGWGEISWNNKKKDKNNERTNGRTEEISGSNV